ncbi:Dehydrogenase reductase protein [Pleurostoma richardsiae]|uniref:Dehydrogenase reductase protein n=1 Tax=Pleurostoma richardsiae TaxID=41990 RepID=A0AA38RJN1_9PEZI|nr:Dehydrogenase reductase protein [Pleurostoma richardsiae]
MAPSRSVIVTGGTVNLGYYAALAIARDHPDYLVVLSSRSDKNHAAEEINRKFGRESAVFMPLDLGNLDNVRSYAKTWFSKGYPPIQALVLNAGLQFPGTLQKTVDGLESTFGINHVGHALLFHLLCPSLAPNARVVVVSSGTHDPAQKSGLPDAVYTSAEDLAHPPPSMVNVPGRQRYASSKLANILWTYVLDRKLRQRVPDRGIAVNAFDPGLMPGTGLAREGTGVERFLWNRVLPRVMPLLRLLLSPNIHKPEESGAALARAAVGSDLQGVSGKYFEGLKEIKSSKDSYDEKKQEDLWEWTVKYLAKGDAGDLARFEELK